MQNNADENLVLRRASKQARKQVMTEIAPMRELTEEQKQIRSLKRRIRKLEEQMSLFTRLLVKQD